MSFSLRPLRLCVRLSRVFLVILSIFKLVSRERRKVRRVFFLLLIYINYFLESLSG